MPIVKITTAGLAAAISASGSGLSLALTHMALGGTALVPTGGEAALPDIRETQAIAPGSVAGPTQFTVTATFPSFTGGSAYTARAVGIYAGNPSAGGILFAIISDAGYIVSLRQPGGASLTPAFTVALSGVPDGSVSITVDPLGAAMAALLAAHTALESAHPQYSTPVGMMAPFPWSSPPLGWLEMNGQLVSRTAYPLLWARAQSHGIVVSEAIWPAGNWGYFSSGDGSTNFRMPDARGEFFRNADRGRGVDPGRGVMSWQDDLFRSHNHTLSPEVVLENAGSGGVGGATSGTASVAGPTGATGGSETRPRSLAPLWCMFTGTVLSVAGPPPAASPAPIPPPTSAPVGPPPPAPAPPAPPPGSPEAAFSWSFFGGGSLLVSFFDSSTNSPTSWFWEFGDGTTSTDQNPTHLYPYPGGFTAFLTATNATGATTTSRYIFLFGGDVP